MMKCSPCGFQNVLIEVVLEFHIANVAMGCWIWMYVCVWTPSSF
jgi:hypothetical protein